MNAMSPFFDVPPTEWLAQNRSGFAIADAHPVSPGHALVVPRRLIASWWEASPDERVDLLALVDEVKARLDAELHPDGYNVGFNVGVAAGQTIEHLHLHVIPRFTGDVDDPAGGIRGAIPSQQRWPGAPVQDPGAEPSRGPEPVRPLALVAGPDQVLHPELVRCLGDPVFDRVDLVVSFVLRSGLDLIGGGIDDALDRGAQVRVLTTDYLGITERAALGWLLDRMAVPVREAPGRPDLVDGIARIELDAPSRRGTLEARVFTDATVSFHPKAYLFWSSAGGPGVGFVGSSNVSRSGLAGGIEWNLRTDEAPLLHQGFQRLWEDRRSAPLPLRGWPGTPVPDGATKRPGRPGAQRVTGPRRRPAPMSGPRLVRPMSRARASWSCFRRSATSTAPTSTTRRRPTSSVRRSTRSRRPELRASARPSW